MIIAGILALICGLVAEFFFRGLLVLSDRLFGPRIERFVAGMCMYIAYGLGMAALMGIDRSVGGAIAANVIAFMIGVGISKWLLGDIRA